MAELNGGSHAQIELSEVDPGYFTATISGELDIHSVARLNGAIDELLARPLTRIELDLSDVEFMDSSGLALLLRLTNQFGPARVKGAKPIIRRVIEVSGLAGVLQLDGGAS
jgi:anti-sigma B factor antagonist